MRIQGQRFLVTGGAGFIGSHLCERLVALGGTPVVLDNLSAGHASHLEAISDRVEFHQASVLDPEALASVIQGVSGVFHLAAIASVAASVADPLLTHEINLTGTLRVAEAVRKHCPPARIVFSSSAAVYGANPELPKRESMATEPLSPYGLQKSVSESYLAQFNALYSQASISLRYFNVFGPRQDPSSPYSGVVSTFCDRARAGEPLLIHGDGSTTRDFVYVTDVVEANVLAMTSANIVTGVFNVGIGSETNLLTLAKAAVEAAGSSSKIEFGARRAADIDRSVADISRTMELLGYRPQVSLLDGLKATLLF